MPSNTMLSAPTGVPGMPLSDLPPLGGPLDLLSAVYTALKASGGQFQPMNNGVYGLTRSMYTKPDIASLRQMLTPVMLGLFRSEEHFISSDVLPIVISDNLSFQRTIVEWLPTLPGPVPVLGVPRQLERTQRSVEASTKRYGLGSTLEGDYFARPEGVSDLSTQLKQIANGFLALAAHLGVVELARPDSIRDQEIVRNIKTRADLEELWARYRDSFALAHRNRLGVPLMFDQSAERIRNRTGGLHPTVAFFSPDKRSLITSNDSFVSYDKMGPLAVDMALNRSGRSQKERIGTIHGMDIHELPTLPDSECNYGHLQNVVRIGSYALLHTRDDQKIDAPVPGFVGWELYNENQDNFSLRTVRQLMRSSPFLRALDRQPTQVRKDALLTRGLISMLSLSVAKAVRDFNLAQPNEIDVLSLAKTATLNDSIVSTAAQQTVVALFTSLCDYIEQLAGLTNRAVTETLKNFVDIVGRAATGFVREFVGAANWERLTRLLLPLNNDGEDLFAQYVDGLLEIPLNEIYVVMHGRMIDALSLGDGGMVSPYYNVMRMEGSVVMSERFVLETKFAFLVINPLETRAMERILTAIPGRELGETVMSRPNVQFNTNSLNQSHHLSYTGWLGIVIHDPKRRDVVDNAFYRETICGANTELIDETVIEQYKANQFNLPEKTSACLYVIPILDPTAVRESSTLFTRGRCMIGAQEYALDFPFGGEFSTYFGFNATNGYYVTDMTYRQGTVAEVLYRRRVNYVTIYGQRKTEIGATPHGQFGEQPGAAAVRARGCGLFPEREY